MHVAPMVEKLAKENNGDFTKICKRQHLIQVYSLLLKKSKAFLETPSEAMVN